MRETSKLPTASLRAPNRHLSFHSQSPRAKRRYQTRGQQNSTECDRVRRTTTKTRARPRARQRHSVSLLSAWIAPRWQLLSSFPRRRESHSRVRRVSIAMPAQTHRTARFAFDKTELTYYSRTMTTPSKPRPEEIAPCAKHPNCRPRHSAPRIVIYHSTPNRRAPRGDTKLAVSKILQNATESDEPLRKLVRARARGNRRSASFLSAWIAPCRHSREGGNLLSVYGLRPGRNGFLESPSHIPPCQ